MKKSYLMIAAAAALFAACAENDTFKDVDTRDVRIGFESKYTSKPTKAEINDAWLTADGSNFGVYGFKYAEGASNTIQLFDNEQVTYETSKTDWTHTTIRYWDKAALDAYYFYACAPYSSSTVFNRTAVSPATTTGFEYDLGTQVFADVTTSATIDLCVAQVEETDYNECYSPGTTTASDGHVSFTFSHVLSKLSFAVKSEGFSTSHKVILRSIKVVFPTASNAKWIQTAKNANPGKVTYTGWTNPSIADLTNLTAADLAKFNTTVFEDNDNVTTNDVVVTTTAASLFTTSSVYTRANSYIVTPNAIAEQAADQQKHKIYLEVKYDIDYNDASGTIDSQTAYGVVEQQFEQDYHYTLIVNIKPAEIRFDVDAVQGFTNTASFGADVE